MNVRFCSGGERVSNGKTASRCSGCVNGICASALACEVPEPEPQPTRRRFLPSTREGWGRLIGAGLGICGVVGLFLVEVANRLQLLP